MTQLLRSSLAVPFFALAFCVAAHAQQTPSKPAITQAPASGEPAATVQDPVPPQGTVLFQSHGEPPPLSEQPEQEEQPVQPNAKPSGPELTDSERAALTFTAYDLDARLTPAISRLAVRARLTIRNHSAAPLTRLALQISSTLQWERVALVSGGGSARLQFVQHLLDTDADHTGKANEAVVVLPAALDSGQTVVLDTFYAGTVPLSTARLQRLGAAREQAVNSDWDEIAANHTAMRGFGNVLWYPVASPQVFLGEGAQLFEAIGRTEQREQEASVRLRVGVEYAGDPPTAVYFCGRRQALKAISDTPDAPIAVGTGIATAEFAEQKLGFRLPSLVVVEQPETMLAPLPQSGGRRSPSSSAAHSPSSSSSTAAPERPEPNSAPVRAPGGPNGVPMLAVESSDTGALPPLAGSAQQVAPLLTEWLGERSLSALTIVDQPGQPFEDGPLLLAPIAAFGTSTALPAMAHSLTHAWVQTGRPWMDEGLAEFFSLLWTEREQGHDAAAAQLDALLRPLAIAEPDFAATKPESGKAAPVGQPLVTATSELYFRRKAATVWWMLRGLASETPLQLALQAWRVQSPKQTTPEADALAFEALLEKTSGKDLHWFFDDWVLHDRGLPDLEVVDVTPRELPPGTGRERGWLVSVTVRNEGAAAAEVPVVVRSGTYSTTSALRVAGFSNATARVLVETPPTEVLVNDGNTPEQRTSRHSRMVVQRAQ